MNKFPKVREIEEKEAQNPFSVEYSFTAKGWIATGTIRCDNEDDKRFWTIMQNVIESVMLGNKNRAILNESTVDGFSRYLRPVKTSLVPKGK